MKNKRILFLSKHKYPHIGGVETHLKQITKNLSKRGYYLNIISEEDIKPPHIKYFGLLYIWYWLFINRKLITESDAIHIHDVFIWYLPFKFIIPNKKVFVTFHGWEGKWPIPVWNIMNKKMASKLSSGSIAVGKYIEKYYGVKANYIIHGAIEKLNKSKFKKRKNTVIYLGRQDVDTGIDEFKKWLKTQPIKYEVKYVTNDPNPEKYLKTAEYCVPSGYLSYLEAKNNGCRILTFADNPLKEDYWKEIKELKVIPTWDEISNIYIKLWGIQ